MSFKKNRYVVVKNALKKEIAEFIFNYFKTKKEVFNYLREIKYLPENVTLFGIDNDLQVPGSYSHYGDVAMDTLLLKMKPIMEKNTGLKLVETYSYARIYKNGDVLKRHKDRPSCEISCTLNLGGDIWPIFIEPSGKEGKKGIKVNLRQGDMLIYRGDELEHWREPFDKKECVQVFLHFNDINSKYKNSNKYDGRPMLGIPSQFKI